MSISSLVRDEVKEPTFQMGRYNQLNQLQKIFWTGVSKYVMVPSPVLNLGLLKTAILFKEPEIMPSKKYILGCKT